VFSNTESRSLSVGIEEGAVCGTDRESEGNCEWVDRLLEELTRGKDLINILDSKLNQRNSKVNELNSRMGQAETKVTEVDRKMTQMESKIK
jgi:phage shock protein A